MFEFTPLDIFWLVLAFCVLWMTAACFWLIYQIAQILRNVNETMRVAQNTFEKIQETLGDMKKKFGKATSTLPILISGAEKIVSYAIEKKKPTKSKKAKK